jgi:hypothetical protein
MGANKAEDANEHGAGKLPGRIATGRVGRRWRLSRGGHTASTTPGTSLEFVEKAHLVGCAMEEGEEIGEK